MAKKPADATPAKGGSGMLLILGGVGCGGLFLLLLCGGVGTGIWYWQAKPADAQVADARNKKPDDAANPKKPDDPVKQKNPDDGGNPKNVIDDIKAKNPLKGTAPLGRIADADLEPPFEVWDFTIRVPKAMKIAEKNRVFSGPTKTWTYRWQGGGPEWYNGIGVIKMEFALNLEPVSALVVNRKFKSDPGDPIQFDTIHLPQPIEINGLNGARMWLLTEIPPVRAGGVDRPKSYAINVIYRYHFGGYAYLVSGSATGPTEAATRQAASPIDAAICTFRKK
jgi:hypothetical protein